MGERQQSFRNGVAIAFASLIIATATLTYAAETSPAEMSAILRSKIFKTHPSRLGLTPKNHPDPVYAVVMDLGTDRGVVTFVTVADGGTSLYFSRGGGIIGAGEHRSVREAARNVLAQAQNAYKEMKLVSAYPTPKPGQVSFYLLTFDGIRSLTVPEASLAQRTHVFADFYFEIHRVINKVLKLSPSGPR
jgi:hypothetical protein